MEVIDKLLDITMNQIINPNLKDRVLDVLSKYIELESTIEELSRISSTIEKEEREEVKKLLDEVRRVISKDVKKDRISTSHIPFYVIQREKEKYAKELSEKNEYLEKLILTCCEYGVITFGSCEGHEDDFNKEPFICLAITKNKREIIYNIIKLLFDKEYIFFVVNINNSVTGLSITLPSESNENADNFFKSINEAIESTNLSEEYYYLLPQNIRILMGIFKKKIHSNLNKKENYYRVGFKKSNGKFIYSIIAKDNVYRDLMWSCGFSYIRDNLGIIEVDREEDATIILNRFYDSITEYHRNNNPKLKQR